MKAYTDLKQSKKLAKILPLDSADMVYIASATDDDGETLYTAEYKSEIIIHEFDDYINCWSLAALLDVLPKKYYPIKDHKTDLILGKPKDEWCVLYWDTTGMQHGEEALGDNPVDACVDMILKLKERNLL